MNSVNGARLHREFREIGVAIDLEPAWPVLELSEPGVSGLYQPVADTTGIVFVRHGATESVDAFVARLGGMFTEVAVVDDQPVDISGRDGRRVTVVMMTAPIGMYRADFGGDPEHEPVGAARMVVSVIGTEHRDIPILVGYRLPEEALPLYRDALEAIVTSTKLS
jgi:hypothetical protein